MLLRRLNYIGARYFCVDSAFSDFMCVRLRFVRVKSTTICMEKSFDWMCEISDFSAIFNYNFRLLDLPRSPLGHFIHIPSIQIELCSFVCPPHIQWAAVCPSPRKQRNQQIECIHFNGEPMGIYILNSSPFFFLVFFFVLATSGSIAVGVFLAFLSSCCVNIANVERNSR